MLELDPECIAELRAEIRTVLLEDLALITPAMIEAGSRAQFEISTYIDQRGRRQLIKNVSAAVELAAIWQAMLAAKLAQR